MTNVHTYAHHWIKCYHLEYLFKHNKPIITMGNLHGNLLGQVHVHVDEAEKGYCLSKSLESYNKRNNLVPHIFAQ